MTKSSKGKIIFDGIIRIKTGMHIGGSTEFAAIGAVDNVVIKDPLTKLPIIPGSSLKGKMRYLLSRYSSETGFVPKIDDEPEAICRLFGKSSTGGGNAKSSRLQFYDMFMTPKSVEALQNADTDLYVTEIKFENTINRISSVANPRQQERVPAGAEFAFKLVYDIEEPSELNDDMLTLKRVIDLLESDYLGGHGTRGYGRVVFSDINHEIKFADEKDAESYEKALSELF